MVDPNSPVKQAWDFVFLLALIYTVIAVPVRAGWWCNAVCSGLSSTPPCRVKRCQFYLSFGIVFSEGLWQSAMNYIVDVAFLRE